MKRKLAAALALLMSATMLFTACGKNDASGDDEEVSVISTVIETDADGNAVTTAAPETDADGNEIPSDESETQTVYERSDDEIASIFAETEATQTEELGTTTVDISKRYAYDTLSDSEKDLYNKIFDAAKTMQWKVDANVDDLTWKKVFGIVYNQEPQLFYVVGAKVLNGKIAYQPLTNDQIKSMTDEINKTADALIAEANKLSTDYDKLLYFHDWIVLNCTFDGDDEMSRTIYGGLVNKKVQCLGYAKTMQYLCDKAGIPSMVITGSGETASHAWNLVNLDGEWYNLDTTWDDPIIDPVVPNNLSHKYFLVKDSEIHNISHFKINEKVGGNDEFLYFRQPAATADKYNYFKMSGKLFSDQASAEAALKDALKAAANNKERCVEIRLSDKSVYDAMKANLASYSEYIKGENSAVAKVYANNDDALLIIQIDLAY